MEDAQGRRKAKEMEVMVADVVLETPDTATLVFFTGNDRLDYRPGHFLTIDPHQFGPLARFIDYFEEQKGRREPPRAYSMCSTPDESRLAVTVKEERYQTGLTRYPPLLSPLLVHGLAAGTRMQIVGFTGPYILPDEVETRTDHLVHLCAGSGVVPNFAILKHALAHHPRLHQTLVFSNKTHEDIIFHDELSRLERAHSDRLRVIHALTREAAPERDPRIRKGRIDLSLLREVIHDPSSCLVYACGPGLSVWDKRAAREQSVAPQPRFLEHIMICLQQLGVPADRIRRESYG